MNSYKIIFSKQKLKIPKEQARQKLAQFLQVEPSDIDYLFANNEPHVLKDSLTEVEALNYIQELHMVGIETDLAHKSLDIEVLPQHYHNKHKNIIVDPELSLLDKPRTAEEEAQHYREFYAKSNIYQPPPKMLKNTQTTSDAWDDNWEENEEIYAPLPILHTNYRLNAQHFAGLSLITFISIFILSFFHITALFIFYSFEEGELGFLVSKVIATILSLYVIVLKLMLFIFLIRRLHDFNRSGYWMLVFGILYLFLWAQPNLSPLIYTIESSIFLLAAFLKGDPHANHYGYAAPPLKHGRLLVMGAYVLFVLLNFYLAMNLENYYFSEREAAISPINIPTSPNLLLPVDPEDVKSQLEKI